MFAHHQWGLIDANILGAHDLVRGLMLQHSILVNSRFVRERICADNGFVRLHHDARIIADQFADARELLRFDSCFEVEDFGIDVPIEKFIEAIRKSGADILAMSSLLTTSMNSMKETIKALKDSGLRGKVKIIVGGAPVTQEFADAIEADCYARDAAIAVDKAIFLKM